ncbi:MAG: hypothetical protein R3E42_16865 [Burkholderiaceae bacterium]
MAGPLFGWIRQGMMDHNPVQDARAREANLPKALGVEESVQLAFLTQASDPPGLGGATDASPASVWLWPADWVSWWGSTWSNCRRVVGLTGKAAACLPGQGVGRRTVHRGRPCWPRWISG